MSSSLRFALLPFAWLAVAACSSSSNHASLSKVDAKSFCDLAVTQCGENESLADCESSIAAILVTSACQTGLDKATCSDLNDSSTLEDTCFPKCTTAGSKKCNGTYVSECNDDGRTFNVDCAAGCTASGLTFTGTCGSSYQGLQSDDGKDQCWCQ